MKKTTIWVSALLAGTLATGGVVYASTHEPDSRGTVTRVIDGDTMDMEIAGQETRVRLLNIDTPETVDPNKPVECMGPEASENLKSLLKSGDKVDLKYDVEREDRYGRTLAAVYKDGEFINRSIAANGLGVAVKFEPNVKYYQEILDAQQEAEQDDAGLFSTEISCTIPAQVTKALDELGQVPSETASSVEQAQSAAQEAAAAVATGLATGKALAAITPDTHPVTAILLATSFKKSVTTMNEVTAQTQKLEQKHTQQHDDLVAEDKKRKEEEAKAKAKQKAEEQAKREAEKQAAAEKEAAQLAAKKKAEQDKAAEQRRNTAPKYVAPKYVAPKNVAPKKTPPTYKAPKSVAPKVKTPPKSSVPEKYTGPRCYAPGGKSWKPCG